MTPFPWTVPSAADDALLIILCERFSELQREVLATFTGGSAAIDSDHDRETYIAPMQQEQENLLGKICDLQATSLSGCISRAKTLLLYASDFFNASECSWEGRMISALILDLAQMS